MPQVLGFLHHSIALRAGCCREGHVCGSTEALHCSTSIVCLELLRSLIDIHGHAGLKSLKALSIIQVQDIGSEDDGQTPPNELIPELEAKRQGEPLVIL